MPSLADYYCDLSTWEGQPLRAVVHPWPLDLRSKIESAFAAAVADSGIKSTPCLLESDSTNQAAGNRVASFVSDMLNGVMRDFAIENCHGNGYPDRRLARLEPRILMPLELKATTSWDPGDDNRRVLTSSSAKLREQFNEPIHHLLATILYRRDGDVVLIDSLRLDFLEPFTEVKVRLEASVSHKILASGPHYSTVL